MNRTRHIAVAAIFVAAAHSEAVFLDTFDTLSSGWQSLPVETASELVYDVSGGYFRAFGFTPASGGPNHARRMRHALVPEGQSGLNNLSLRSKFRLPLTDNIRTISFSISELGPFETTRGTRRVGIQPFGSDHIVTLDSGNNFTSVVMAGLSDEVEVEILNQGPVASLFINGNFVSTVNGSAASNQNPSYNVVDMYFEGSEGTSAPVSIDFIQVVPEPASVLGIATASLLLMRRRKRGS